MAEPIAPIDAKTDSQLDSLVRTTKVSRGCMLEIGHNCVIVRKGVYQAVIIPRRDFNALIDWYTSPARVRKGADDGDN